MQTRTLTALTLMLAGVALAGCGGDDLGQPQIELTRFFSQETPVDVLRSVESAYARHDIADYRQLLSDDFSFHLETETIRELGLPDSWDVSEDSTGTCGLFQAPTLYGIAIMLQHGVDTPVEQIGRENWRQIVLTGGVLVVDETVSAENPEGMRYGVSGEGHQFCFRRGRSPGDTGTASPTAGKWFLVEWRDPGRPHKPGPSAGPPTGPTPVAVITWSRLKALYR